jgi:hypothetical protein
MACCGPHELLRETRIASDEVAALFGFGAASVVGAATRYVNEAVHAAREFQKVASAVYEVAPVAYGVGAAHVLYYREADGAFDDAKFEEVLAPGLPALMRAQRVLRDANVDAVRWGELGVWFERATAAVTGVVAGTVGPEGGAGLDEILRAASGRASFGAAAQDGAAEASGPDDPEEGRDPQVVEAINEAHEAKQTERSWWQRLSAAVSDAGARMQYVRSVVWRTLAAVAKFAFPIVKLTTVVFAVLFACCAALGFGEYGAEAGGANVVCDTIKALFSETGPLGFLAEIVRPYTNPSIQAADVPRHIKRLLVNAHDAMGRNDGAMVDLRTYVMQRLPESTMRKSGAQYWNAITQLGKNGKTEPISATRDGWFWTSPASYLSQFMNNMFSSKTPDQKTEDIVNNFDPSVFKRLDSVHAVLRHNTGEGLKNLRFAEGEAGINYKEPLLEYLKLHGFDNTNGVYANDGTLKTQAFQFLDKQEHRDFVRSLHRAIWTSTTPLGSLLGRITGGYMRHVGDFIGVNEGFGRSTGSTYGGIAVGLAALAWMYLGPGAGFSVLFSSAAMTMGYDLGGDLGTAVSVGAVVLGQMRQFWPTTEGEDRMLDNATSAAVQLAAAAQETLHANRRAKVAYKEAQGKAWGHVPVVGGFLEGNANREAAGLARDPALEQAARNRDAILGFGSGSGAATAARPFV